MDVPDFVKLLLSMIKMNTKAVAASVSGSSRSPHSSADGTSAGEPGSASKLYHVCSAQLATEVADILAWCSSAGAPEKMLQFLLPHLSKLVNADDCKKGATEKSWSKASLLHLASSFNVLSICKRLLVPWTEKPTSVQTICSTALLGSPEKAIDEVNDASFEHETKPTASLAPVCDLIAQICSSCFAENETFSTVLASHLVISSAAPVVTALLQPVLRVLTLSISSASTPAAAAAAAAPCTEEFPVMLALLSAYEEKVSSGDAPADSNQEQVRTGHEKSAEDLTKYNSSSKMHRSRLMTTLAALLQQEAMIPVIAVLRADIARTAKALSEGAAGTESVPLTEIERLLQL